MNRKNSKQINLILGIDTSCDDTSVAVTYKRRVLSNVVSSQIEMHRNWGGTVPGLAKREHESRIANVVNEALRQAITNLKNKKPKITTGLEDIDITKPGWEEESLNRIDAFAVTFGPGLSIALEVGVRKAKELALKFQKPLIGVNHMEGHLLSPFALNIMGVGKIEKTDQVFPALGVLVSGGHTELVQVNNFGEYQIIGETLDDAIGEAFDKAARILGLGYPGGKIVSELAKQGDKKAYNLPTPMLKSGDLNVSYSGLKTALLYKVRDLKGEERRQERETKQSWEPGLQPEEKKQENLLTREQICDLSASFEEAAVQTILNKIKKSVKTGEYNSILLGGGVVNNTNLRHQIQSFIRKYNKKTNKNINVYFPYSKKLFQDNAAMISLAAYMSNLKHKENILVKEKEVESLDRVPNLRLS